MEKPLIFISHIAEEKQLAQSLKALVLDTFLSMIDVFVASDPTSIKMGRKWLDQITYALKTCAVEIILASPESIKRPWINFEGGSGWIRDIPVIPLCHSGMVPGKLPLPMSALQSATASEEAELRLIFPVLAEAVGCTLPEVDFSGFIQTVMRFESDTRQFQKMTARTSIADTDGLSTLELATIVEVAEQVNVPSDTTSVWRLREALETAGYRGVAVTLALRMLARKDLMEVVTERDSNYGNEEYFAVRLTEEGWNWLEGNQRELRLGEPQSESEQPQHEAAPNSGSDDDIPF